MASDMFRNQSVYSLATACSSQTLKYNKGKIRLCNKTDQWLPFTIFRVNVYTFEILSYFSTWRSAWFNIPLVVLKIDHDHIAI